MRILHLLNFQKVRHSVFVIGNAGTGKSCVWKTLAKTYQNLKMKPSYVDLNPKAVTNDELFGVINPTTREWKDGLFSTIMRDLAQSATVMIIMKNLHQNFKTLSKISSRLLMDQNGLSWMEISIQCGLNP